MEGTQDNPIKLPEVYVTPSVKHPKRLTEQQVRWIANEYNIPYAHLRAIIDVESSGKGFADDGKIIIQFEPHIFKREFKDWASYTEGKNWHLNKVETQKPEWEAFLQASSIDETAAMQSTSIGLMQTMGFNHKVCGFETVQDMWVFQDVNEANQLLCGLRFIASNKKMLESARAGNWSVFALHYNGKNYKKFKYDTRLASAVKRYI
jgi:hypothetical protein